MRKIPPSMENPFDNILIYLSEITAPIYKGLNFTPNTLTSISLFCGIMAGAAFYYKNYKLSALFIIIAYYYDCADGFYARKYNMTSRFGDLYDHYSDYLKSAIILLLMFFGNKVKFFKVILPILVIFFLLMMVQLGCQEKYKQNNNPNNQQDDHSEMLNYTKMFCPGDPEKIMPISKYFGSGTMTLVLAYLVYTFDD